MKKPTFKIITVTMAFFSTQTAKRLAEDNALRGLRGLRFYHWKQVLSHRACAKIYEHLEVIAMRETDKEQHRFHAEESRASINFHLKQVQLLNDFFPIGDTAENDEQKANAAADIQRT